MFFCYFIKQIQHKNTKKGVRKEMYILKRIIAFLLYSSVFVYALEENNELIGQENGIRSGLEVCSPKYCMDRGKCQILKRKSYCLCQDGFMGQRCEIVLDRNMINKKDDHHDIMLTKII